MCSQDILKKNIRHLSTTFKFILNRFFFFFPQGSLLEICISLKTKYLFPEATWLLNTDAEKISMHLYKKIPSSEILC